MSVDLDQGGTPFQRTNVNLGPSLGWVQVQIQPQQVITAGGSYSLTSGTGIVLVNVAAMVTLNLPDVRKWMQESAYLPATGFERAIWIKDLGGNAATFNITVVPFMSQAIDGLAQLFTIVQNRQLLRLYPLADLSGWFAG
jgi:hypothetical protein